MTLIYCLLQSCVVLIDPDELSVTIPGQELPDPMILVSVMGFVRYGHLEAKPVIFSCALTYFLTNRVISRPIRKLSVSPLWVFCFCCLVDCLTWMQTDPWKRHCEWVVLHCDGQLSISLNIWSMTTCQFLQSRCIATSRQKKRCLYCLAHRISTRCLFRCSCKNVFSTMKDEFLQERNDFGVSLGSQTHRLFSCKLH